MVAEDTRERAEGAGSSAADGAASALSAEYFETATRVAKGNQLPVPTRRPVDREHENGAGGGSGNGGKGDGKGKGNGGGRDNVGPPLNLVPIPRPEIKPVQLPKPRPVRPWDRWRWEQRGCELGGASGEEAARMQAESDVFAVY